MLLYYISDRLQFPGSEATRQGLLLDKIREAAAAGVDFIQLREKDLSVRALELLARDAVQAIQNTKTRLLINSRTDIALACGANGVHLRSDDISVTDARAVAGRQDWLVFVSCHSAANVARAAGANMAIFAPVFEKQNVRPTGIEALRDACQRGIPVLALGGVTLANAYDCVKAGAAGIAGIRLFQENGVADVVKALS